MGAHQFMSNLQDRVEREKKWHDARFNGHARSPKTSKFYRALEHWYVDYDKHFFDAGSDIVLEVGAGLESVALKASFSSLLTSIDISSTAIDKLKISEKKGDVVFEIADAHKLPYKTEQFDLIIGRGILHHLDLPVAVPELKRVLKQDGKVVFGEPLAGNPLINLYRKLTPSLRTPDEQPLRYSDIKYIIDTFPGTKIFYYGFFTLIATLLGLKGSRFFRRLDDFVLNKLLLGRYLAWACLIHK